MTIDCEVCLTSDGDSHSCRECDIELTLKECNDQDGLCLECLRALKLF